MSYYDHATAMAFKLDRWAEDRLPKKYELEILESEERSATITTQKLSIFKRCLLVLHIRKSPELPNTFKTRKP